MFLKKSGLIVQNVRTIKPTQSVYIRQENEELQLKENVDMNVQNMVMVDKNILFKESLLRQQKNRF
jgi:histidinol phosphatase-like enzyme